MMVVKAINFAIIAAMKSAQERVCRSASSMGFRALAMVALMLGAPAQGVELKGPPAAKVTQKGVEIQWNTDGLCGTRVNYGVNAERLNHEAEGGVGLYHTVTLDELKPDTIYHFTLGTSKRWLTKGTLTLDSGGTVTLLSDVGNSTAVAASAEKPKSDTTNTTPASASASEVINEKRKPLPKLTEHSPPPTKPEPAKTAAKPTVPPTSKTWGYMDSLQDHYDRHGPDFRCSSPDDYAAKAWMFLQYAKQNGLPMKWDASDGTLRIWEPRSRAFAAYNRNGTTKTFFRPNNESYWGRQPGEPIRASELPF